MADRFPATFLQEWYADAHVSGWSDLGVTVAVRLPHGCGETCVRRTLADLAARHEAFRTTLLRDDTGLWQHVDTEGTVPLGGGGTEFQVCGGQLAHAVLHDGTLLIHAHHAICDGWSAGVVHRDVTELHAARHEDRAPVLPDLPLQFADYAVWEHEARQRPVPPYWRTALGGDRPRLRLAVGGLDQPARLRGTPLPALPPAAGQALAAQAMSARTTVSRLLAALAVAAVAPFADGPVRLGLITSNRHRPELRDVVGDLWDQLPVTVDVAGEPPLDELVARYDAAVTAAQDHHVPLAVVAPLLRTASDPLFDVRVNHFPDTDAPAPPPRTQVVDRWWTGLSLLDFQFRTRADGGVDGQLLVNTTAVPPDRVAAVVARYAAMTQPAGVR